MKTRTVIKTQYITSDNRVFESKAVALNHEEALVREKLQEKSLNVGEYVLYEIENQEELNALMNNTYGEREFCLPDKLNFPIQLCEWCDFDCYYFVYKLLDDVIEEETEMLDSLKSLKKGGQ